ncbi:MAG: cyclic-di-AMP receptor [Clostridiaceae bacterium]
MKLVIAIVQDDDSADLVEALTEGNFRVTKLATTGGFLKAGNTTLLIGVQREKLQEVISIIENICKTREQLMVSPAPMVGAADVFMSYPVEVQVGGATIFVVDVDKFIKI